MIPILAILLASFSQQGRHSAGEMSNFESLLDESTLQILKNGLETPGEKETLPYLSVSDIPVSYPSSNVSKARMKSSVIV